NVTHGDLARWTTQGYIGAIIPGIRLVTPESESEPMSIQTLRKPLKDDEENTVCIFFNEEANGCEIRYSRPISCRTFPLEFNGTKYILGSKDCPGVGKGEVSKEALQEARSLAEQEFKERVETQLSLPGIYTLIMAPMIRQSAEAMEKMSEEDRKKMEELISKSRDETGESEDSD
ncbi:MAG: YkgJ family cysteine cluster protein, partial [Candidatus Hodarchaeota archaeon]